MNEILIGLSLFLNLSLIAGMLWERNTRIKKYNKQKKKLLLIKESQRENNIAYKKFKSKVLKELEKKTKQLHSLMEENKRVESLIHQKVQVIENEIEKVVTEVKDGVPINEDNLSQILSSRPKVMVEGESPVDTLL